MAEEQNELEGVPEPGEIVCGKYRVERVLGVGGMGCVVAATHTTLDQKVAIKFLLVKAAKNPKNIMRFEREAQAAAKIKSDHVAKVTDVGTLDTGTPYMVMEYLDGEDLSERLANHGPLPPDEAVRYILQACEALAEAHRAGIIHRDLKPANLFVATAADGTVRVKVLDFGISKIIDEKNDLTKTSALMGSPLYMSPEQMMSAKAADARADLWALGCILFELVSGQPPFIGSTLPEICSRILTAPPTPLGSLVQLPAGLEAAILHALNKKPEERYQTLAELANRLYPFGGELAARSAAIVCKVLDAPHLAPASSELPTSMGDMSGQHARVSYEPSQPQPGLSTSQNQQLHVGTPVPHSPHGQAPQAHQGSQMGSYPQGASTSQNQYPQVAMHTSPSPGAAPVPAGTPVPGATMLGGVGSVGMTPAMVQGASTGAPVAQTMSEELPRKSRAPLFIGLGAVLAAAIGGAVVLGISSAGSDAQDAAKQGPVTASTADKHDEPKSDAKDEPSADPEPDSTAKPTEPKPASSGDTIAKPATQPVRPGSQPVIRPPTQPPTGNQPDPKPLPSPPKPDPKPKGNTKTGDGLF